MNTQNVPLRQDAEEKGRGKGLESVLGRRERMKRGSGIKLIIKDRDNRSRGIEILMTDAFAKIKRAPSLEISQTSIAKQSETKIQKKNFCLTSL